MNKLLCILILCLSFICCTNSTGNEEKKQHDGMAKESYPDSAKVSTQMLDSIKHFLKLGQYDNAKQCMDFYEQQSGIASSEVVSPGYELYYYIKGIYYINVNKTDSAQILFQKCNNNDVDPYIRMLVYGGLSLLYDKKGVADSTAKYALLSYEANESLSQKKTEESERKSADILTLQWWLLIAIVIIILIAGSSIFIDWKSRKANERKLRNATERYEREKAQLKNEMEEMNALLEEKVVLLESKDQLFERQRMELDEEIARKEHSISELQSRVSQYEQQLNIKDAVHIEDEIQSSPVRSTFEYYVTHVTEHPTDKQWKELIRFTKKQLPQMFILLNKHNVSDRELRICILARLKFKPGEIATIMDCRFPEVSLTRSRLLKRIYGVEGKAADFDRQLMLLY